MPTAAYRVRRCAAVLIVLLGVLCPCALAQVPGAQPAIEFGGDVELARLVDLAAARLGVRVTYDRSRVSGNVTLRLPGPIGDDALWRLVNDLLEQRGFTTVRTGEDAFTIAPLGEARKLATASSPEDADRAGYVTLVIGLQHADPTQAAAAVSSLLANAEAVTTIDDARVLVISDLARRAERAAALLAELDAPDRAVAVEQLAIEHLSPTQLIALLDQIQSNTTLAGGRAISGKALAAPDGRSLLVVAPRGEIASWRALIQQLDRREDLVVHTYVPQFFSPREVADLLERAVQGDPALKDDRWHVVVDELTGTIVVTATPRQHERVNNLLNRLAATPRGDRERVRSFVIRNRDVEELVEVLTELIIGGALETDEVLAADERPPERAELGAGQRSPRSFPPGGTEDATPSQASQPQQQNSVPGARLPDVVLTADLGTNTILAIGEPRRLDQLAMLIAQLDVRQSQVMLEVLIISLSDDDTLDLGVEIEKIADLSGNTILRLASLFGFSTGSDDGRVVEDAAGGTALLLNPGDFTLVIRALQTLNDGRSLSRPRLLVNNNEQAVIDSVIQAPFSTTNASNTVATTSFGGTQDAGTTVTIRPQIAEGDHLVLSYGVALSSFVGDSVDPNLPPPRQQNRIESVATIPDGYTIVVGGIDLTSDVRAISQVPLLGDIPLIGEAFKSRSKSTNRSRFFVFMRASILRQRTFEGLKFLSDKETNDANVDDGWPRTEPRVIR